MCRQEPMTREEWAELPIGLRVPEVARAGRVNERWVQNHAEELGGTIVGGKWMFSKSKIAEKFGLN